MGLSDIETIPETGAVFTIGRSRFADNVASHFFIRKDPVISITCGDEHSAVICQSGRLFVFGSNDWGQLGLGHKNHVSKPSCVKILKPEKVTHVACGRAHTLICTAAQKIFACGSDQEGQLGRGSSATGDSASSPVLVYDCGLAGPRIVEIAAGSQHSLALTSDGGVVAWGSNLEGQLGLSGISGLVNKPIKVPIPEPVKRISAGYYHSAFLTESGLVYVCGESESGKLGIDVNFSTQVAPKQMQLPSPAVHVACGGHHTVVLAENGNLYCVGSNASGQLGMGTNVTEVQTPKLLPRGALQNEVIARVACGESHTAVLTESGKLFMCGDGRHGKLGLEENENNVHELTLAPKYQELFVSNVACGGCHTILVANRLETGNKTQRETEPPQTEHIQKKNPLPPLKLPLNRLQNEAHEEKTNEKDKLETNKEKSPEPATGMPATATEKSMESNEKENSELPQQTVSNGTNSMNGIEKTETSKEASEEADVSSNENKQEMKNGEKADGKVEENSVEDSKKIETQNGEENHENGNENAEKNKVEDNGTAETKTEKEMEAGDGTENKTSPERQISSSSSTPPPKPPRLKSGSGSSTERTSPENRKDSSINANNSATAESSAVEPAINGNHQTTSRKSSTQSGGSRTKSKVDLEEAIEIDEQTPTEEVDGKEKVVEQGKVVNDVVPDDADVVQSPAPKTGKMSKMFKAKQQEEIENGTKTTRTANHKAKSRTCVLL